MLVEAELLRVLRVLRLSPSTVVALAQGLAILINFQCCDRLLTLALPSAGPIFRQPSASPEITSPYLTAENSGLGLALGIRQDGDTLVCGRVDGAPHLPRSITLSTPEHHFRVQ